jgi:hypothetical protein
MDFRRVGIIPWSWATREFLSIEKPQIRIVIRTEC